MRTRIPRAPQARRPGARGGGRRAAAACAERPLSARGDRCGEKSALAGAGAGCREARVGRACGGRGAGPGEGAAAAGRDVRGCGRAGPPRQGRPVTCLLQPAPVVWPGSALTPASCRSRVAVTASACTARPSGSRVSGSARGLRSCVPTWLEVDPGLRVLAGLRGGGLRTSILQGVCGNKSGKKRKKTKTTAASLPGAELRGAPPQPLRPGCGVAGWLPG